MCGDGWIELNGTPDLVGMEAEVGQAHRLVVDELDRRSVDIEEIADLLSARDRSRVTGYQVFGVQSAHSPQRVDPVGYVARRRASDGVEIREAAVDVVGREEGSA